MEYLNTIVSWMQSTGQIILVALFVIGFAAMVVAAVHPATRQQKNAVILAYVVVFIVVVGITIQVIFR